jgi:hypothetical protein
VSRFILLAVLLLTLAAAGCGGSNDDRAAPPTTTASTTTTAGTEPLPGASTVPVTTAASSQTTALLENIDLARHEGYDRVVFQFENVLPGYRVAYVEPPLNEDGSGAPVKIEGDAFVSVRMEPASGFDLNTGEGVLVYKGPRRIEGTGAGTSVVRELVRTGDFEAVLTWAVGLGDPVDFRVLTLADPPRLVVDFDNR